MIIHSATRYLIIDYCFDVIFGKLLRNFSTCSIETNAFVNLSKQIYSIFSKIQEAKGNSVVSFDSFLEEQSMMLSGYAEELKMKYMELQLLALKRNYPQYS